MARRKKRGNDGGGLTGKEWMDTYSDMVTLLLTFFILLYTFSSVDNNKLKSISQAFQSMFSGQSGQNMFDYNENVGDSPVTGEEVQLPNEGEIDSMYNQVKNFVDANNMEADVQIREDDRGVILQIKDSILFESGKSDLKEDSKAMLNKINSLITTFPNNIIIEGHTDNVPINNDKFNSNWELSSGRASTVVRYFVEDKKQKPDRFTASGCGEFKPLVANDSDEHKAQNRRVNILIVATKKES